MAINASAYWRVRIDGNDLNGAGFDAAIVGAGTDYTDQATAQLSLSDLATAGVSANISSATGGFTSAMIGNAIRIASGTNFTVGTYFITAVTNTNNATLDRNCSTGAGASGVCKIGGAVASFGWPGTSTVPVSGNVVYVRGQGSNEPVDIDYYTSSQLNAVTGLTYIGYNGRPKVSHRGELFYNLSTVLENFYFIQTSLGQSAFGVLMAGGYGGGHFAYNCVFDSGGFDATQVQNASLLQCAVLNTGAQSAGTNAAVLFSTNSNAGFCAIDRCLIKDQRSDGIKSFARQNTITNNVIQNCLGNGITFQTAAWNAPLVVSGNTIYSVGGHGIQLDTSMRAVHRNLISEVTGGGKYGIYVADAVRRACVGSLGSIANNSFYGCTTNSNVALSGNDLTVNPNFVNAPVDLTPTNTALRIIGGVGAL